MSRKIWEAMARERPADTRAMLTELYGTGRGGRPDTRAAAAALGVSQRTVQRWVRDGTPKQSAGADRLRGAHQQWRDSEAGRRANINPRRAARMRNKGTTLNFYGKISVSNDTRNATNRATSVALTGAQASEILDHLMAGDDAAAKLALENAFGDAFGTSVELDIGALETFQ